MREGDLVREGIVVRRGVLEDAEVIAGFNCAIARETEEIMLSAEVVRRGVEAALRDRSKGRYYLAEVQNEVVGQVMVTYEWSDWRNAWFWWVQSVYVCPEYRRGGVFRRLFEHVRHSAGENPEVCGLRLYAHRDNEDAKTAYSVMGMHLTEYDALYELALPSQR